MAENDKDRIGVLYRCPPTGKAGYRTKREAKRWRSRKGYQGSRIYRCPACDLFHLTTISYRVQVSVLLNEQGDGVTEDDLEARTEREPVAAGWTCRRCANADHRACELEVNGVYCVCPCPT